MTIVYRNGNRVIEHLDWAQENEEYKYKIVITKNNYHIKFDKYYQTPTFEELPKHQKLLNLNYEWKRKN